MRLNKQGFAGQIVLKQRTSKYGDDCSVDGNCADVDNRTAVGEVCRKAGISEAMFCNSLKKYAGLMPTEMRRLRQLEDENAKLKRQVPDADLDKAMLHDVVSRKL